MELLTFGLILATAWILWRRPERERLALRLLVVSIALMIFLFALGTRTSLLPGLNY
jgi:heme A synthase